MGIIGARLTCVLTAVVLSAHGTQVATAAEQASVPATGSLGSGPEPVIGERFAFHGYWLGIPVGYGWIETKERAQLDGCQVVHIEAHGYSNRLLSTFYPITDVVHSFLDVDTLQPLRFEKHQQEGHYRADEVVTFDPTTLTASYHSLLNHSTKQISLPDQFQDLISTFYWLRRQSLTPESTVRISMYTDEKIYDTLIRVGPVRDLELLKRGTFRCVIVEPEASFKGLLVKRGRVWAYVTADARRLPVLIKATTPWGPMTAVLDESSVLGDSVMSDNIHYVK